MAQRRTIGLVLAVLAALALPALPATGATPDRAVLAGSVPPWANAASFKQPADGSESVGFRVYLGWQDPGRLAALAQAVSTPGGAAYGHYLTPAQFHQQFSPPQSAVNAVRSWLREQGFNIVDVPGNNHYVAAEGSVAQAATAFGVSF